VPEKKQKIENEKYFALAICAGFIGSPDPEYQMVLYL
jgi:hypothetical protein